MPNSPEYDLKKHDNGVYYIHWSEQVEVDDEDGNTKLVWRSKRTSTRAKDLASATTFFDTWRGCEEEAETRVAIQDVWDVYNDLHVQRVVVDPARLEDCWKQLKVHFADRFVDEIDALADSYIAKRRSGEISSKRKHGVKGSTIRKELLALSAAVNFCIQRKHIRKQLGLSVDDAPFMDLPAASPPKDRWLSFDEAQMFFDWAARHRDPDGRLTRFERFLWLALYTAPRRRSIETLRWKDQVDFDVKMIYYLPKGATQTNKRRVPVPISQRLLPVLERAYAERIEGSPWVMDHSGSIRSTFETCRADLGMHDVTPHTLRHTAATWMARSGVDLWIIAGILGDTIETVTRVYAKHCPDALRSGVDAIDGPRLRVVETDQEHGA